MLLKNIPSLSNKYFLSSILVILSGCSCIPRYTRLPLPTPETYPGQECVQNGTPIQQLGWQDFFNDPTLKGLICLALENNRELRAAIQQVKEVPCDCTRKLIGQVANTYLIGVELNELICNAMKTIKTREEISRILKLRFKEGAASEFDFLQAEMLLEQAKADLVALQRRCALNWNAMTLLVGIPICPDDHLLSQIEPYFMTEICPGLPSELLYDRPDVYAAWNKLSSVNSCMGQNLAVTEYERTLQVAFREVADALAERIWLSEQILSQKELLDAQTERVRLAWIRFQYSTTSFLEVLDAERERFSAEQAFVQTRRSLLASGINLYIALGGGCYR